MHWRLGCGALAAVVVARLSLRLLPFRLVQRWSNMGVNVPVSAATCGRRRRVAAAVAIASTLVPGASCLTQALAAQALLRLKGDRVSVCYGAMRDHDGEFRAHAWLAGDASVILGEIPTPSRFAKFTSDKSTLP